MAFSYSSASSLITSGAWSLTVPTTTGAQGQIVGIHLKTGTYTAATPAGHTLIASINVRNSKLLLFFLAVGQDRSTFTLTGVTKNGTVTAGEGEVFLVVGPFRYVSLQSHPGNIYQSTQFSSPAITVNEDGSLVLSIVGPEQYPRTHVSNTTGITEIIDLYSGNGPALAVGGGFWDSGDTPGPFLWTPTDAYNPAAAGGEYQVGATLLLEELTAALDPVLSGGGTIPVVEVQSKVWAGFSVFAIDSANAVTLTITGTDAQPFSGVPVVFAVSGQNTLSATSVTTDASGVAGTTITTPLAGSGTITASVNGVNIASQSFTVAGSIVTLIASPDDVFDGQTLTLSGEAFAANGSVLANTALSFQISGGTYEIIGTAPTQTTASGTYAFQIQATSVGTLSITVTVGGVSSQTRQVIVRDVGEVDAPKTDLRLRLQTFDRANPAKR